MSPSWNAAQSAPDSQEISMTNNNDLHTFDPAGFKLRVITTTSGPWFVAGDVSRALEITRSDNLLRHLSNEEKSARLVPRQTEPSCYLNRYPRCGGTFANLTWACGSDRCFLGRQKIGTASHGRDYILCSRSASR